MKKILVIGGANQGKLSWVKAHFPEYKSISIDTLLKANNLEQPTPDFILDDFHLLMKEWLEQEEDYQEKVKRICRYPSWIIISDEIGSGIVPIEKKDRKWRECTGRMLCELARHATDVYRIYCGIPMLIKGGENT